MRVPIVPKTAGTISVGHSLQDLQWKTCTHKVSPRRHCDDFRQNVARPRQSSPSLKKASRQVHASSCLGGGGAGTSSKPAQQFAMVPVGIRSVYRHQDVTWHHVTFCLVEASLLPSGLASPPSVGARPPYGRTFFNDTRRHRRADDLNVLLSRSWTSSLSTCESHEKHLGPPCWCRFGVQTTHCRTAPPGNIHEHPQ